MYGVLFFSYIIYSDVLRSGYIAILFYAEWLFLMFRKEGTAMTKCKVIAIANQKGGIWRRPVQQLWR